MKTFAFISAFHGAAIKLQKPAISQSIGRGLFQNHNNVPRFSRPVSMSTAGTNGTQKQVDKKPKNRKQDSIYSETVNLPKTTFEQRANAVKREPELQSFWDKNKIYEQMSRENPGETFALHDGPPFANGPLHCGHALNKILKDIINKYHLMNGRKAVFVPGWDTHGLPIELKVLQSISSKERRTLSPLDLRKRASKFARETVENHIKGMKRFGVWGDWNNPYLTLEPEYEAKQIEVFGKLFESGFIFRGKKPVHWSPSSRTALAEAELEYPDNHVSKSCYCSFHVHRIPETASALLRDSHLGNDGLSLSIWTTTPWTIPANRAVAVNADLEYALVKGLHPKKKDVVTVIAKDLVESVSKKLETEESITVIGVLKGKDLLGVEYSHPLEPERICRVVEGGDYITTETGTGLVHTAPGHGQEDYQTGLREGLDLISPVDDAGKFTDEAAGGRFTGLPVLSDGTNAVIEALQEGEILMLEEAYSHKYPYDWRTKKPTIFRATEQWFISIDSFRNDVLAALDDVNWYPASGVKRIRGMVEGRGDWCISRQRSWGVPIPVFYTESGEALMTSDIVDHVQSIFKDRGADAWWELDADDLLPDKYKGKNLTKGRDTMDVWFDSGSSWAAVSDLRPQLQYPADIYLEGSDQHRGWFQSSMLTSVATRQIAPYKNVLTHGFVLDEKGVKMSKSIGNVIDPMKVINGGNNKKLEPPYGSDVLRLWVSSVDYTADIVIGPAVLKQVSDVYKKFRNTLRYMAGNIHDFDPYEDAVPFEELPALDKYMLSRLNNILKEIDDSYKKFAFFKVYQALQRFAVVDLSNFYLDIAKDRLYIPNPSAARRRSCQTVMAIVLENISKALAPILSHTTEDLWQNLPYTPKSVNPSYPTAISIFQSGWFCDHEEWKNVGDDFLMKWETVRDARDAVNKVLETARNARTLGASMEASVKIFAKNTADREILKEMNNATNDVDSLMRSFLVSNVKIVDDLKEVSVCAHTNEDSEDDRFAIGMDKYDQPKCERCWHLDESVGNNDTHPSLCDRCVSAVGQFTPELTSVEMLQ